MPSTCPSCGAQLTADLDDCQACKTSSSPDPINPWFSHEHQPKQKPLTPKPSRFGIKVLMIFFGILALASVARERPLLALWFIGAIFLMSDGALKKLEEMTHISFTPTTTIFVMLLLLPVISGVPLPHAFSGNNSSQTESSAEGKVEATTASAEMATPVPTAEMATPVPTAEKKPAYDSEMLYLMGVAETKVLQRLKDPDSAKFSDVRYITGKEGVPMACGWINAKNSFGAYTGKQRFFTNGGDLTFLEKLDKKIFPGFWEVWDRFCVE